MVKITGAAQVSARLARMGPRATDFIGKALYRGGKLIAIEAQTSITRGAVSGKNHVPSRPGEPPNADTHRLADNIETVQINPLRVEVSSNASYSVALEFGTSKMLPRPFMKPAATKKRPEVVALVKRAIEAANKG